MTHPQIGRALRLMNMEKNGTPTVAEFEALLTDQGRLDACVELMRRPGAEGQITGYPNLLQALTSTDAGMALALSNASIMAAVAQRPSAMLAFINDQSALDTIFSQPDVRAAFLASTALGAASVPTMTSNAAPSGAASSFSENSAGYASWKAFDGDAATFWNSAAGTTNLWLQYSFAQDAFINKVVIQPYVPIGPRDVSIQYSDDGVIFTTAKSLTIANAPLTAIDISVAGFHKHWRLFMHNIYGGSWAAVHELNFTGFFAP